MEPTVAVPTIGSIVLYQRHGSPNGQHKSEPSPAIVTSLDPQNEGEALRLSLFVVNPNGIYFNHHTPYDPDGAPGTWRWP